MSSVNDIKIKELTKTTADIASNDDLMILDKSDDTYSISVSELKILLSSDKKIEAVQISLIDLINRKVSEINDQMAHIKETADNNAKDILSLSDSVNAIKANIVTIFKSISLLDELTKTHSEYINTINTTLNDHATHISTAETDISNLTKWKNEFIIYVKGLEDHIARLDSTLSNLMDDYSEFVIEMQNTIAELKKADIDNTQKAIDHTNDKYADCMKYIDYFFHTEVNPPNFDEPWYWEEQIAGYAHPVHSLFRTTDTKWDPSLYKIPGVWTLRYFTTLSEEENIIEYVYERME